MTGTGKKMRAAAKQIMSLVPGMAANMAAILRDPKNNKIVLRHKGNAIRPAPLIQIAGKLGHSILVYLDKDKKLLKNKFEAVYYAEADLMILNFKEFNSDYARSAIIHESIHCINDMFSRNKLTKLDDEFMAFTAQAMYLRLHGMTSNNIPGATNTTLFPAAFAVADSLLSKRLPDVKLVNQLERELLRVPVYRDYGRQLTSNYAGIK